MLLDRSKLMRELDGISDKLFIDISNEFVAARLVWQAISANESFLSAVTSACFHLPLPVWQGQLGQSMSVDAQMIPRRTIIAVDGSQIYPDRHQGSSCFLINVGSVILSYGFLDRKVSFSSEPYVFVGDDESCIRGSLIDFINCRREELEFRAGVSLVNSMEECRVSQEQMLLLFDGSLIFWHLEDKDPLLESTFMSRYCAYLDALYGGRYFCAGYISCPKNKDLVNLIRFAIDSGMFHGAVSESLDHILDVHVAEFFLTPCTRTIVFKHRSKFCDLYPPHLRPYFFYLHVGSEVARVELPAWIALEPGYVDIIASMILDNSLKGRGYPVALAEAHEQAVVKGPDRDFFYHLIQKVGIEKQRTLCFSQKNVKKRGMGI